MPCTKNTRFSEGWKIFVYLILSKADIYTERCLNAGRAQRPKAQQTRRLSFLVPAGTKIAVGKNTIVYTPLKWYKAKRK